MGGMVGVSGIGQRGGSGRGGGAADGLSRALEMVDVQQANRHRTRLAKLPSLMAHVRSSRVAKKGWWWSCHARTAEGGGGGGGAAAKGISGGRRESRCGGHFCRKGGTGMSGAMAKKRKKQEQLGARHVMSLIIHRSAGNVVPCEARLPEQMLPGACDWGRRQPAFPPRSWDVVSASVRLWLCAVSGLVAPPVSRLPLSRPRGPAQEPRSAGAKVGFAEAGCSPTFRLPPEVVSVRRVLGSGPIGRYWGRPGAPGHRLCCSGAAISAVSTWACSGVVPRGQDSQAGARRQAPGTRAPQILGRAGCEAAPGWWKSRRSDFWRGLPWFCLGCWGAGLARWILPDPSIGTGSICSRVLELLWRLDWGPRACFLVLPVSRCFLRRPSGILQSTESLLASGLVGKNLSLQGSHISDATDFGDFPHCSRMGKKKKEILTKRPPVFVGGIGGPEFRRSRPTSESGNFHERIDRLAGSGGEKLQSSSPRRGRCKSHLSPPPRGISIAPPWMCPRCTAVPAWTLLPACLGSPGPVPGRRGSTARGPPPNYRPLPYRAPFLGSHGPSGHAPRMGRYLSGGRSCPPEERRRTKATRREKSWGGRGSLGFPSSSSFSLFAGPFPPNAQTVMASIYKWNSAAPSPPCRASQPKKRAGCMRHDAAHTLRDPESDVDVDSMAPVEGALEVPRSPLPPLRPSPTRHHTQYPNPAYHSRPWSSRTQSPIQGHCPLGP